MTISTEQLKQLRNDTGVSFSQCKKALEEAQGDVGKAKDILKRTSSNIADKKSDRELGSGAVAAYIHNTKDVGCMVELLSETDFVAKNEEFYNLAYDIALHTSAMNPKYTRIEDISKEELSELKEMYLKDVDNSKPDDIKEKIINGKLESYYKDFVLLEQPFVKDDSVTIKELINKAIQKFGERIELGDYTVYRIGR